jgi:hypothetical protein
MTSSDNAIKDRIDTGELISRILQISGGELEIWKRTVLADKGLFKQLYELTFSPEHKIAWRACWIIDNASEDSPELLLPYIREIVSRLAVEKSGSMKRHFTRMLCRYQIPEGLLGQLVDISFKLLSPIEDVAVRANAMQLLYNISRREPDLKGELAVVLETLLEEGGTPGIVSKASKLLMQLRL